MTENFPLLLALLVGAALGVLFFGGLWWSVRRGVSSPRPVLWFFGSLMLRMSIVLIGFYFIGQDNWERLVACLLGFVIARFIVMRLTRTPSVENYNSLAKEANHAP